MMKMKDADAFERSLKEAMDAYEVPYNSADWAQLEQRLEPGKSSTWQSTAGLYALFLGGSVAVLTTIYVMMNDVPPGNGGSEVAMITEPAGEFVAEEGTSTSILIDEQDLQEEDSSIENTHWVAEPLAALPTTTIIKERKDVKATANGSVPKPSDNSTKAKVNEVVIGGSEGEETPANGVAIKPSVTEGCPGVTVEFAVENMPEDGIHLWNFGDGNFSNKPAPTHTFSKSGTFEVMLSHSSIGGGNIRSKPASDRIVIHEAPEAAFYFRKDEYDNSVPSVRFDNRSIGGTKYHWDFGDGTNSAIAHPNHVYKKKGTYQATLTTTNAKGCIDRADQTIVIDNDYNLLAPRTFSPDNNGFEDSFIPEALRTLGVKFHMSIFDSATGELLYETTDPQRPWNGKVNNKGTLCEPGEYVWLVEMKDGEVLGGTYTGNVSLLR